MKNVKFPTRFATGRNVLLMLAVYLFFPLFALPSAGKALQDASGQPDYLPLDLRPGFSPDEAWQALEVLGPSGRASYQWAESVMDVAYPLTYGIFFALLIAFLFLQAGGRLGRMTALAWLPLGGTLFDWLENIGILRMISLFPERADGWARFAALMGEIKWFFSGVALLYIVVGLVAWGMAAWKNRSIV